VKNRFQAFAFKCNLNRYSSDADVLLDAMHLHALVGLCSCVQLLNAVAHSLQAPGFNPLILYM
jgi:hypothetical protein